MPASRLSLQSVNAETHEVSICRANRIEERRNMSFVPNEFAEGRMKPKCHSAKFGLPALQPRTKPESARIKAESARMTCP
jgi:hypothetical protein